MHRGVPELLRRLLAQLRHCTDTDTVARHYCEILELDQGSTFRIAAHGVWSDVGQDRAQDCR